MMISDCESSVSGESPIDNFGSCNLVRVEVDERVYDQIKNKFLSSLGSGFEAEVVAIRRRVWSVSAAQANLMAFRVYARAVSERMCGNANVKFAWFGAAKSGVEKIVDHGFSHQEISRSEDGGYGRGVCLSPDDSPLQSVQSTVEDEDGLRHVLLCKVLLGNMEIIPPGSDQTHPTSDCFDSGVDDIVSPKKYIVWSTNMNTHILPEFVITFKATIIQPQASSPWMSFPALIGVLSSMLSPDNLGLINPHYNYFKEKRIARDELVKTIRRVAGDKLLATVIKSCKPN